MSKVREDLKYRKQKLEHNVMNDYHAKSSLAELKIVNAILNETKP